MKETITRCDRCKGLGADHNGGIVWTDPTGDYLISGRKNQSEMGFDSLDLCGKCAKEIIVRWAKELK